MLYIAMTTDYHGKDFVQSDIVRFTTDRAVAVDALENDYAHNGKSAKGYSREYRIEGWNIDFGSATDSKELRRIWNNADEEGIIDICGEPDYCEEISFDE